MKTMNGSFLTEVINEEIIDWITKDDCPLFIRDHIANILIKALGINGTSGIFCKCKEGGYNLSWYLDDEDDGREFIQTFSKRQILEALKNKVIDYEWSMHILDKAKYI